MKFKIDTRDSEFLYHVQTTLHPMSATSRGVEGEFDYDSPSTLNGTLRVPVKSFKAEKSDADPHVWGWTEANRYPDITIALKGVNPIAGTRNTVNASVTFHGVTRDFSLPVEASQSGDTLIVAGSHEFTMTEFGIKPPTVMMLIRAKDYLKAQFRITARLVAMMLCALALTATTTACNTRDPALESECNTLRAEVTKLRPEAETLLKEISTTRTRLTDWTAAQQKLEPANEQKTGSLIGGMLKARFPNTEISLRVGPIEQRGDLNTVRFEFQAPADDVGGEMLLRALTESPEPILIDAYRRVPEQNRLEHYILGRHVSYRDPADAPKPVEMGDLPLSQPLPACDVADLEPALAPLRTYAAILREAVTQLRESATESTGYIKQREAAVAAGRETEKFRDAAIQAFFTDTRRAGLLPVGFRVKGDGLMLSVVGPAAQDAQLKAALEKHYKVEPGEVANTPGDLSRAYIVSAR